ncbi:hypothetical protein N7513_004759 [Penicillium frequentans]|uniref:Uncharacterized protein n=1 Tax=Penicillium frequentans TaxID=3151616 RepID=A0AAD6D7Y2_9EURO|nr:hypothetical protein N7513_004759 [Penicillium glabrum]KAJ5556605.1 hypothetical protein N7494_000520 [Penicillium glabrum]
MWAAALLPMVVSATDATLEGYSGNSCGGDAGDTDSCERGTRCILWKGRESAHLTYITTGGLANIDVTIWNDSGCTDKVQELQLAPGCQNIPTGNYITCCQQGTCP